MALVHAKEFLGSSWTCASERNQHQQSHPEMPGKRKRGPEAGPGADVAAKPLTAIAAARLRTEAAAKVVNTPQVTLEPTPIPSNSLLDARESEGDDSDAGAEIAPIQRNLRLCNWRNELQDILSNTESELTINLNKHTTIALVGCFEFKVLRGAVHINGANIGTVSRNGQKNTMHRAYVPATHPISKIRGLDGTNHLVLRSCKTPVPLAHMSPLFDDLWSAKSPFEKERSFRVVSTLSRENKPCHPLVTFFSTW
jgi:polynucleotide 5'-hydroxyl-kinase GRC3/NOL9